MAEGHGAGINRRQLLQAAGVAAAGVAAAGALSGTEAQASRQPSFRPRGRLTKRPNFLVFIVDEQRYAPSYESEALKVWRRTNLRAQEALRRNGFEFNQHRIMSTACQPSRASMFTGQYPSLHGVSQTSGSAKAGIETDLFWLDPSTVPTFGSWFREAGYDTYWKGKWHVSDTDLFQPGSYNNLPSYTDTGLRDAYLEDIYLEAGILEKYGFSGFVGPEPHGSNPLNSGSSANALGGRDRVFEEMGIALLQRLRDSRKPWFMVSSFVNPHDITLWGDLTVAKDEADDPGAFYLTQQLVGSNVPNDLYTSAFEATKNESLSTKPTAQASYVGLYPSAFQPLTNDTRYHRFYYQLQKNVDSHVYNVLRALKSDRKMYENTIVIYMSDHGDVLGAHGGMFQKWHNAYDEMMHVPFIMHNPVLFPKGTGSDLITSHADLLPTMLGLAGLNEVSIAQALTQSHTQVRRLVGRDLSPILLGEEDGRLRRRDPVYFMTDDQIFRGAQAVSVTGMAYPPVVQPASVESVLAYLPTGVGGSEEQWKYSRYWDNPALWTTPNVQDVLTFVPGKVDAPGDRAATTTVTVASNPANGEVLPPADEFEMYNLTADPLELNNLAGNSGYSQVQRTLGNILDQERAAKRLQPTIQPWANGSMQQFPYTPS